jgi:hypothetical protein
VPNRKRVSTEWRTLADKATSPGEKAECLRQAMRARSIELKSEAASRERRAQKKAEALPSVLARLRMLPDCQASWSDEQVLNWGCQFHSEIK